MIKIYKSQFFIMGMGLLALLGLIRPVSARAEEVKFFMIPPILEVESEPGSIIKYPIFVAGTPGQTYELKAKKLIVKDNEGHFSASPEYEPFLDWISFSPANFMIEEDQEHKTVNLTVKIPENADLRDYYCIISMENVNNESKESDQSGNTLSGALRTPLLITVQKDGEPVPERRITEFNTSFIHTKNPISFKLELENKGNKRFKSYGYIKIKNLLNGIEREEIFLPQNILSNSTRIVINEDALDNREVAITDSVDGVLGIYEAQAFIYESSEGPVGTGQVLKSPQKYYVYIHPRLILGTILLGVMTISIFVYSKSKREVYLANNVTR